MTLTSRNWNKMHSALYSLRYSTFKVQHNSKHRQKISHLAPDVTSLVGTESILRRPIVFYQSTADSTVLGTFQGLDPQGQ